MAKSKHKLGPEIAIVLGSGILDGDRPGPRTALCAAAAAELALAHPKMAIIASGDGRSEKQQLTARTEASHIKRILRNMGIAKKRILLESESLDTLGNGVLVCAKFLHGRKPRKVYIVTSPFHEARALLIFRNVLGPDGRSFRIFVRFILAMLRKRNSAWKKPCTSLPVSLQGISMCR